MKDFNGNASYAVGVRHTRLTSKRLEATVYYPVDKKTVKDKPFTAGWFPSYKSPASLVSAFQRNLLPQAVLMLELHSLVSFKKLEDLP